MKQRSPPPPQTTRRRPNQTLYLLAAPLLGGILTHIFDLFSIQRYSLPFQSSDHAAEFLYAAEVAPQLLRHKKQISLDGSDDWSHGVDRLPHRDDATDSERYKRHESDDGGECVSMHPWQESSFPACNSIHEMDFFAKYRPGGDVSHVAFGGFNDLYRYRERFIYGDERFGERGGRQDLALKILKYEKNYTEHKFGVVRQDSVTLERLSKSPHVYDIYGYCAFALIVPYMTDGNLDDKLREWRYEEISISSRERMQYAVDMARGLRDLHDIDGDGVVSATHGDLKEHQYLLGKDGRLVLGDFNKGQFLSKSSTSGKTCTYRPPSTSYNDKVFRSPEEYMNIQQTAATDIYALGSLFYYLLTGERVWEGMHSSKYEKKVQSWIIQGKRPRMDKKVANSKDPVDVALKRAYDMCTEYEPEKRPSAREVSDFLEGVWEKLNKKS